MSTQKTPYVFRKNPIASHSNKQSRKTEMILPRFGAEKTDSTGCCGILGKIFLFAIMITGLLGLPGISIFVSNPPIFPYLYWIPGIIVSGIMLPSLLFYYKKQRSCLLFPACLALATFYTFALLQLLHVISLEWYWLCSPIFACGVFVIIGFIIHMCCCKREKHHYEKVV